MGLVEYSSSSSDAETDQQPRSPHDPRAKKRRRTISSTAAAGHNDESGSGSVKSGTGTGTSTSTDKDSGLPPLPPGFHDLYASTVRAATADLPSLHQGRRRVIPHVAGNWPSHIYAEWHPSPPQHGLLRSLLAAVDRELQLGSNTAQGRGLATFLTSDLGAPLPLHVSLSRPFVLRTADKDGFLDGVVGQVEGCGVRPFELSCDGLGWHRGPESERSFLVLHVRTSPPAGGATGADGSEEEEEEEEAGRRRRNRELSTLLARCNDLVASYGQPRLYQWQTDKSGGGEPGDGHTDGAFHVSIAWSFAEPTDEIRERTAEVCARDEFRGGLGLIRIPVDGVKAKIGNVVTNIALSETGKKNKKKGTGRKGLFGV